MPLKISITIYVEGNCLGWSTGFVIVTTGKRCLRRSRHIITVLFSVKTALVNYSFASEKSLKLSKDSLSMIFPTKPLAIGNNIARVAISYSNYVRMKQFKPVEFREGSIWLKPKSLAIVPLLLIFQSWLLKDIMAATDNRTLTRSNWSLQFITVASQKREYSMYLLNTCACIIEQSCYGNNFDIHYAMTNRTCIWFD